VRAAHRMAASTTNAARLVAELTDGGEGVFAALDVFGRAVTQVAHAAPDDPDVQRLVSAIEGAGRMLLINVRALIASAEQQARREAREAEG
jgi:hypothetical protein